MSDLSLVKIQFKCLYRGFKHEEVVAAAISFNPMRPQYAKQFAIMNKEKVIARMVELRLRND